MSQLRWSLLILGMAFIAALGWWERRRPRQGRAGGEGLRPAPRGSATDASPRMLREPGANAAPPRAPREPPLELPEIHVRGSLAAADLPVLELAREQEDVPVLSAARSTPAAAPDESPGDAAEPPFGESPVDLVPDLPGGVAADAAADTATDVAADIAGYETADTATDVAADIAACETADAAADIAAHEPADAVADAAAGEIPPPAPPEPPLGELPDIELDESDALSAPRDLPREQLPELPGTPAPLVEWPPDPERRVVALRLVATQPGRFPGRSVRQALAAEGFVLGRFAIFHKPDEERRAVLSAASLTRPGTFDPQTMDSQRYGGLSLFAVVPGPHPLPETFEELVATARSLNQRLQGMLQDEAGSPLTPARIASLREHLGRETPA
jgi:FtsZ-interacting cell division protein ZipA